MARLKHFKSISYLSVIFFTITLGSTLFAKENRDSESGFTGEILIGIGAEISESESTNKSIENLDDNGKESDTEFRPLISGKVSYTFEDTGTKFHIKKKRSQEINLGMSRPYNEIGTVDLTLKYSWGSVWKNPYLLDSNRDYTKETKTGIRLSWDNIMDMHAKASYQFTNVDIKDDVIGDSDDKLRRNGSVHALTYKYQFFPNQTNFFTPAITLTRGNIDGEVYSFNGLKLGGKYTHINQSFMVNVVLSFDKKVFDEEHPTFFKTREDQAMESRLIVTKFNPLGVKDINISLITGYSVTDSNIAFYDSSAISTGIELAYKF